jgi:hypothetical protein
MAPLTSQQGLCPVYALSPLTTGQQLSDLKKAYDSGVISKEEYEAVRESILEGQR